ncbi:carboxylate--amine ligase [Alteromonas sp. KUL156]|nr:carboxylate--amine ligase [Alteromonas sp. KUL154]GFE00119.1 carboxylate--amine ligase [Alteromonas sp. KUL156]
MTSKKTYNLILGGYVNGYSIVSELYEKKVENIALFSYSNSLATKSKKLECFKIISKEANSLKEAIFELKEQCDYIVIYPTDDIQIENLHEIYEDIKSFCFIPFNKENIISCLDKNYQYKFCKDYNIPYPKSIVVNKKENLKELQYIMFPLLVKPAKRYSDTKKIFRNLYLESKQDFDNSLDLIISLLNDNISLIFSEFIPGDDTNIYAYTAYRSKEGKILNEWVGKKLTQYPDEFGVFSSAVNSAPEIVRKQGRELLKVLNLYGIAQPEFKYDERDGQYKLMEINLRSMMWHRLGNLTGVYLQYTQYLDATNNKIESYTQNLNGNIHFIYLKHEITNLLFRKKYFKHFKNNVFKGEVNSLALYDVKDLKPFIFDQFATVKFILSRCLKALKIK